MSWQMVLGHDDLVQGFQRAVARGRLAHAYLFTGPAGVGKHLFAVELAKALLCEGQEEPNASTLEACDSCPACKQVLASTHPDFYPAARPVEAQEFPIELMRELCRSFSLRSSRGRGKVVILDGADDLNEESANCFLKTLEEPPPRSVLILIGSSPDRQLPTIVSRCQVVRFRPLAPELVAQLLRQHGGGEASDDDRRREMLARLSGGSPGLARALSDPALWDFRRTCIQTLIQTPLNAALAAQQWMKFVEEAGKESSLQRRRAQLMVRLLLDFLSDALVLKEGGTPRRSESEDRPALERLTQRANPEKILALLERCLEADKQLDRTTQLVLILEALWDALAQRLA